MTLVEGRVRRGVVLGFVVACAGAVGGCGGMERNSAESPAAGAGGDASSEGGNRAGESSGSGSGGGTSEGLAGATTTAGAEGKAGSSSDGAAGITVPRIENTDGESVLVTPAASLGDGRCQGSAVHCNGICLSEEQQAARNCTLLKLGLGQTGSLALSSQALLYTAANREIIKLDLASGEHTSLVRGLSFVDALHLDGEELYFSTKLAVGDESEVRRVGVAGGDVTVLSPPQPTSIPAIVPLVDRLVFQVGAQYGGGELFAIPKAGGAATPFGNIDEASLPVLSASTLYYLSNGKLHGTNVDAPAPEPALSPVIGDGLMFVVEGEFIYDMEQGKYSRTPITGGARQPVQVLDSPGNLVTYLVGRTPTHVVLRLSYAGEPNISHLLTMPINGNGTPTEVATIEQTELQAVVGDATHLYLAVGASKAGGLLRIAL